MIERPATRKRKIRTIMRFVCSRWPDLRVEWNTNDDDVQYSWDGEVLRPAEDNVEMQMHDICHWIVCPDDRKKLPEFGLGGDPARTGWRLSDQLQVVSEQCAKREEELVCALQLCVAIHLKLNHRNVTEGVNIDEVLHCQLAYIVKRRIIPGATVHSLTKLLKTVDVSVVPQYS